VNSDYRPIVDQQAPKTRFLDRRADGLVTLARNPVPVLPMLGGVDPGRPGSGVTAYRHFESSLFGAAARRFAARVSGTAVADTAAAGTAGDDQDKQLAVAAAACAKAAGPEAAVAAIVGIAAETLAFLSTAEIDAMAAWIATQPCGRQQRADVALYMKLISAIGARDPAAMAELGEAILALPATRSNTEIWLAAGSALVGHLTLGRREAALKLVSQHRARLAPIARGDLAARIALAHAGLTVGRGRAASGEAKGR